MIVKQPQLFGHVSPWEEEEEEDTSFAGAAAAADLTI